MLVQTNTFTTLVDMESGSSSGTRAKKEKFLDQSDSESEKK